MSHGGHVRQVLRHGRGADAQSEVVAIEGVFGQGHANPARGTSHQNSFLHVRRAGRPSVAEGGDIAPIVTRDPVGLPSAWRVQCFRPRPWSRSPDQSSRQLPVHLGYVGTYNLRSDSDDTVAHFGQGWIASNGSGWSCPLAGGNRLRRATDKQYRRNIKVYPRQFPPLHTSSSEFIEIRDQGGLYVDKTGFFRKLLEATPVKSGGIPPLAHKFQFLARPRRFGKSLLVSTLEAWFQGIPPDSAVSTGDTHSRSMLSQPQDWNNSGWLWQGLDTEEWHGTHGWHPVLRIDMSVVSRSNSASIQSALDFEMANLARGWADRGVPWGTGYLPPMPQGNGDPAMALRSIIDGLYRHFRTTVVVVDE